MRLDARIKQFFPGIVAMVITLVAYLQAVGFGHLFAAQLGDGVVSNPQAWRGPMNAFAPPTEREADGSAILARNPFDSITGPFNKDDSPTRVDPAHENNENPYADPICDSLKVLLITTAEDPSWSFAAIAVGNERATLRRVGDGIGDRIVHAMVWDRVWMSKGDARCQLPLHREMEAKSIASKPGDSTWRPARGRNELPPEIANGIRQISDTRYEVERSIIDVIADKQREIFRTTRIIPTRDADGSSVKLLGIKPGSLLASLGLVDGDKLQTVNGFDMSDPMIAMQAYGRLLTADKLDVRLVRRGKPLTIEIKLR